MNTSILTHSQKNQGDETVSQISLEIIELLAKKYGNQVYLAYFHSEEDCQQF